MIWRRYYEGIRNQGCSVYILTSILESFEATIHCEKELTFTLRECHQEPDEHGHHRCHAGLEWNIILVCARGQWVGTRQSVGRKNELKACSAIPAINVKYMKLLRYLLG